MHTKKILVNAYTHVNLGDDLFLKILFEKFPNTRFAIIGNKSKYEKIFKDNKITCISFPNAITNKYVRKIFSKFFKLQYLKQQFEKKKNFLLDIKEEFDAVVTIGGSIFIENNINNSFRFGNHKVFADVFADKPKFIIGSNFGPYRNKSYLNFFNDLFEKYDDVCFRDSYSQTLFSGLQNVRTYPDVVFSGDFQAKEKIPMSVGISVMDFSQREKLSEYNNSYQEFIVKIIKWHIDQNHKLYLFSFCEYEGDERAIDKILELVDDKYSSQIKKVYYKGNIDSFLECFSMMETMYSSRFHAMILSMVYEQKIHPIIYSKKMTDVLNDLSYNGKFTDLKNINDSDGFDMSDIIPFRLDSKIMVDADKQFEVLKKFLNS